MTRWSPSAAARRREPARGALLGTFVGDALGMPWEGLPAAVLPAEVEMVEARRGRGTYTDDTEMMIGLAESLVEVGDIDPDDLAQRFLSGHDPSRGYGAGTLEVFALWRSGHSVEDAARSLFGGEGSLGNGAAMRIAPIGIRYAESPELADKAERSARVTHTHRLGVDAAVVQAVAVAAAATGDDPLEAARAAARTSTLRDRLDDARARRDAPLEPAATAELLGNSSAGHESVPLAVYAAVVHDDFEAAVKYAVRCGGDTDTVAAMAGAIAGARFGASTIPQSWLAALEDGERGRSHVEGLAERLAA